MIKPLGERILVKPIVKENKTEGGLILPNSLVEDYFEAEVIAIPEGEKVGTKVISKELKRNPDTIDIIELTKDIYLKVKVGDKVLCPINFGMVYKIGKVEYIIIRQSDIIAVL